MKSSDLLELASRNLLRRKTRTVLAIVGVVVGICAIVVMLSIGFGLQKGFQEQIESFGNLHLINVYPASGGMYASYGGGVSVSSSSSSSKEAKLDDKTIALIDKIEGVTAVSPTESGYFTFIVGKFIANSNVTGIRPEVLELFNYEVEKGRLLKPGDKFGVLFGNQVPYWFYNPKKTAGSSWGGEVQTDVVTDKLVISANSNYGQKYQEEDANGNPIQFPEYKGKGVGILANPNDDSSYTAYMPIEDVRKMNEEAAKARKQNISKNRPYQGAMVYVGDINVVQDVSDKIREMGLQTSSLNDWLKSMQQSALLIQGILGGIGAISLLVAALGIANTMIMSIYERTKEIGVMKVIGANLPDIRRMFLLEAAMIGFLGGAVGIAISYMFSLLLNTVLAPILSGMLGGSSTISIIPLWLPVAAVGFATVIGVLAGYSPARRAMNLSALESLRNE